MDGSWSKTWQLQSVNNVLLQVLGFPVDPCSWFEHVPVAFSHLPACQCLKDVNPSLVDDNGDGLVIYHLTLTVSNLLPPVKFQENSLTLQQWGCYVAAMSLFKPLREKVVVRRYQSDEWGVIPPHQAPSHHRNVFLWGIGPLSVTCHHSASPLHQSSHLAHGRQVIGATQQKKFISLKKKVGLEHVTSHLWSMKPVFTSNLVWLGLVFTYSCTRASHSPCRSSQDLMQICGAQ